MTTLAGSGVQGSKDGTNTGAQFKAPFSVSVDSAGNAYLLDSGPPLRGRVASTGGWDQYRRQKIGTITLKAGEQALTFHPDGKLMRRALLDLRAIALVPVHSP